MNQKKLNQKREQRTMQRRAEIRFSKSDEGRSLQQSHADNLRQFQLKHCVDADIAQLMWDLHGMGRAW